MLASFQRHTGIIPSPVLLWYFSGLTCFAVGWRRAIAKPVRRCSLSAKIDCVSCWFPPTSLEQVISSAHLCSILFLSLELMRAYQLHINSSKKKKKIITQAPLCFAHLFYFRSNRENTFSLMKVIMPVRQDKE